VLPSRCNEVFVEEVVMVSQVSVALNCVAIAVALLYGFRWVKAHWAVWRAKVATQAAELGSRVELAIGDSHKHILELEARIQALEQHIVASTAITPSTVITLDAVAKNLAAAQTKA
jgi:hypothetical protein